MMNMKQLARRGEDSGLSTTHVALLASLLILFILGLACIGALMFLRSIRKARKEAEAVSKLPLYEKRQSNQRGLTIKAMPYRGRESVLVYSEKQDLMSTASSPTSPVPEIRITFPDEVDESGKKQSGRVVVVRVGEHSVGLEPYNNDELPPYQRDSSDRFDSLDLDRIGGLKEKDSKYYA
jgi:hypothetical protein